MAFPVKKVFLEPRKAATYLYFYLHYHAMVLRHGRRYIRFTGHLPRRPYAIWKTCRLLGLTPSLTQGEPVYHHIDDTVCEPSPLAAINGRCCDIGKTTIGRAFEEVFGYALLIADPRTHQGRMVAKSERNATHDGTVLQGPLAETQPHLCYQREIDNRLESGEIVDLRTAVVGNEIALVLVKIRQDTPALRFDSNASSRVIPREPEEIFSAEERQRILAFCRRIGLDLGELDILRDRGDGRIYVVDASKTAHTPSTVLSLRQRIFVMKRLAASFARQFLPAASAAPRPAGARWGGQEGAAEPGR